jgi:hypothetical protein
MEYDIDLNAELRAKTINKFMGPKESHMAKTQ